MSLHRSDQGSQRMKTSPHQRKTGTVTHGAAVTSRTGTRGTGALPPAPGPTSRSSGSLTASGGSKSPGRSHTQNPGPNSGAGSDRRPGVGGGKQMVRRPGQGMGLRAKFMLVMSGISGATMVLLGIIMTISATKYLGSQKRHDGIEVAQLAAQLASSVADQMVDIRHVEDDRTLDKALFTKRIEEYLTNARLWGDNPSEVSDLLAVQFNMPDRFSELSLSGFGSNEDTGAEILQTYRELFIPKSGSTITIPNGIAVFEGVRKASGSTTPIYRFKVRLDHQRFGGVEPNGTDWSRTPYVNVDMNAASVNNAQINLSLAILLGVILSIAIAIGVANWLAGNITKPVEQLVRDMKIVAKGHLDHETIPRSHDEIGVLAFEFNRMTENLKEAQSALVEQEKAEYELSIAREVQRQLLPANAPDIPGFQCGSYYLGAKAVSGDYFDYIDLGNGLWGFIIADVSGKGIPGSMVMAVTRTIIRLVANKHLEKANETLKDTNRLISRQIKRGMFVTSFYAVLDSRTGKLTYACAGHNPMVIYRGSARTYELASGKGIALGFNEGPIFDKTIELHQTMLNRGDGIVLYTDGFPEAMNASNEEFGDEKFYQLVPRYGSGDVQALINGLVGEVAKHRGEAEQSDDLTLLAVRRT